MPAELSTEDLGGADVLAVAASPGVAPNGAGEEAAFEVGAYAAVIPPWSAASPYANLYGPKAAARCVPATVVGNVRVTEAGKDYDTHHIVLDFGAMPFPVLEGQSIGIVPPASMLTGERITRGNIRSRARATASGPATTTCRSP